MGITPTLSVTASACSGDDPPVVCSPSSPPQPAPIAAHAAPRAASSIHRLRMTPPQVRFPLRTIDQTIWVRRLLCRASMMWRTVIETPRLLLVPLTRSDADDLFPVLDHPGLHRFIGGEPLTREALIERFARLEAGAPADRR